LKLSLKQSEMVRM